MVSVLVPCDAPKFDPLTVNTLPTGPEFPARPEIYGVVITVNTSYGVVALDTPPTVTTMWPVVAPDGTYVAICVLLQVFTTVAGVPLNVTVLVPCVAPKFDPLMAMYSPTPPVFGVMLAMLGAWA